MCAHLAELTCSLALAGGVHQGRDEEPEARAHPRQGGDQAHPGNVGWAHGVTRFRIQKAVLYIAPSHCVHRLAATRNSTCRPPRPFRPSAPSLTPYPPLNPPQSVPLVIGQFNEMIDAHYGIVGSTAGSTYYVRILSTLDREKLKPNVSVALHRHSHSVVDILPPESDSTIQVGGLSTIGKHAK
jgi:hypothetical protein